MSGLLSTLNTGVSGLNASEIAISTTSHNISNANNAHYTRQRVQFEASHPTEVSPGAIGTGVSVTSIVRIHDEFVYQRLNDASRDLEYSNYMEQNLKEVSSYFPDLDGVGLKDDLVNYFNAWNDFASNPTEGSQKINLIQTTQTMTTNLQDTRLQLRDLQNSINDQLKTNIDELNRLGQDIADINKQINKIESLEPDHANDLRDKRDQMELTLAKLIDFNVYKGDITSYNEIDTHLTDQGTDYHLNIAGFSFIDGTNFHPIVIDNTANESAYYSVYHEQQDGQRVDMTLKLSGGKIGAMLDLRGRTFADERRDGFPTDGVIQEYIDDLDTFAKTLIVETNNIYAESARESMISNTKDSLRDDVWLTSYDDKIYEGTFDAIVYDSSGKEVARKTLTINSLTTMNHASNNTNSLVDQFNTSTDDNGDNNATNDVDDYFTASYSYDSRSDSGVFSLEPGQPGYTIAIEDNGTNFAGVMGLSRYFSGESAKDIDVDIELSENPSKLQAFDAPINGNNKVANKMIQLQYESVTFERSNGTTSSETMEGFYRFVTTSIASDTESTVRDMETNEALYNTVYAEFQSVSGVNMDEELTNLMKFQTSYSANAKIITTIDQMLDTLLGIKQ